MKFAVLGRTHWLYDSIEACIARGHECAGIGTAAASPEYKVDERDFEKLAEEIGCPFLCTTSLGEQEAEQLASWKADVAISVNWPILIRPHVMALFKHGVVNAHVGDLPRFRGNAAPNWAILLGESSMTVTLHNMVADLDAGDILLQRQFAITDETYVADAYRFMEENIPQMYAELLDQFVNGSVVARSQSTRPEDALRCLPRRPADGLVEWRHPAGQICRMVRASSEPFSGAFTFLGERRVTIWRASTAKLPFPHVGVPGQVVDVDRRAGHVQVLTGEGLLVLEEVELAGGARCSASDVVSSTRQRFGFEPLAMIEALQARVADLESELRGQNRELRRLA